MASIGRTITSALTAGPRAGLLVSSLLLAMLLTACSGDGGGGSDSNGNGTPAVAGAALAASDSVLTVPVSFQVVNRNHSPVLCASDGLEYTISGQLTGPASQLGSAKCAAATLYLHGLGFAAWYWNFDDGVAADEGYATALGGLGHVSVTIDRLGHGASPLANGNATCLGAQADIAHQIVQQLKAGTYLRDDGGTAVAFGKVALGGHSAGGGVAEAEAYGFGDIDALLVMNWTDQGASPLALLTLAASETDCVTSADGYASFGRSDADFQAAMFHDISPQAEAAATAQRVQDPCGDLSSVATTIVANDLGIGLIHVPVLLLCSADDALFPAALCSLQNLHYLAAGGATLLQPADTGHAALLERSAPQTRQQISEWLASRGF